MLISKDCTGKTKSIYKCDRCKCELIFYDVVIYQIKIKKTFMDDEKHIKMDVCRNCYKDLLKTFSNGVIEEKREERKERMKYLLNLRNRTIREMSERF